MNSSIPPTHRKKLTLVKGIDSTPAAPTGSKDEIETKVAELVKSGKAKTGQEALVMLFKEDPGLYDEYVKNMEPGEDEASAEVLARESDFLEEAQKLITAGRAKTDEEAFGILASEQPALYEAYNRKLIKFA